MHRRIVDLPLVDQARDQVNGPDLPDQTGVQRDFAKAFLDLGGVARQPRHTAVGQLDEHDVTGIAFVDQRKDCRIGDVAAVPVVFAVDLDSLKHGRHAAGCHQ